MILVFVKRNRFQLFLILIWLLVLITNWQYGTFLSGWDNLHPEFNLKVNLLRTIFTSWQEYQGIGLLGGMGHGADLVRQLILLPLAVILPDHLLRYFLTFGSLLLGTIGAYQLVEFLSPKKNQKSFFTSTASFFAGLFYLLNLATLQNFYVPFEPFYWFYAFLPWLLLGLFKYLTHDSRKNLIIFTIFSLLATPIGYIQTTFIVYFLIIIVILINFFLKELQPQHFFQLFISRIKPSITTLSFILAINAFWLIPVVYFTLVDSGVTVNAKMNRIATPEVYLQNLNYGNLNDIFTLKGYWFDLTDFDNDQLSFLYAQWKNHLNRSEIQFLSYFFVVIVFCGILASFQKKLKWRYSLLSIFLLVIFMLLNENPPTGFIFRFISENIPLFKQVFRSPFTKWVVPLSLTFSIYFGLGIGFVADLFKEKNKPMSIKKAFYILTFITVLTYSLPTFKGNFIYPKMRVEYPQSYFELFEFFNNQPKQSRIAFYPTQTFWGWNFYDWNYRGSGFLWYGVEQPILDRAFDVWNRYNQTFYQEFSKALYDKDIQLLSNVLKKYDVHYVLVDESVINPGEGRTRDQLLFELGHDYFTQLGATVVWQKDFLTVYDFRDVFEFSESFVSSVEDYVYIDVAKANYYTRFDPIYLIYPNYVSNSDKNPQKQETVDFFLSSFNKEEVFPASLSDENIQIFTGKTDYDGVLYLPAIELTDHYHPSFPAVINYQNDKLIISFQPLLGIKIDDQATKHLAMPDLEMAINDSYESLLVIINNEFFEIDQGESLTVWLEDLQINQPITLQAIDASQVRKTEGEVFVPKNLLTENIYTNDIWQTFLQPVELPFQENSTLSINLPTVKTTVSGGHDYICSPFQRGMIETISVDKGTLYIADEFGANCQGANLSRITNSYQSYFINLRGKNIEGRSLRFYVEDLINQQVVFETIASEGEFDHVYSLMMQTLTKKGSYSFTVQTQSFGQPAKNLLSELSLYALPLPIEYLSLMRTAATDHQKHSGLVEIDQVKKIGTFLYIVNTDHSDISGLITLSQGFGVGWKGLIIEKNIFQSKILRHFQHKGWANAWQVPAGQHTVVIIYWPQLLQFAGFVFTISTLVYVIVNGRKKNK